MNNAKDKAVFVWTEINKTDEEVARELTEGVEMSSEKRAFVNSVTCLFDQCSSVWSWLSNLTVTTHDFVWENVDCKEWSFPNTFKFTGLLVITVWCHFKCFSLSHWFDIFCPLSLLNISAVWWSSDDDVCCVELWAQGDCDCSSSDAETEDVGE